MFNLSGSELIFLVLIALVVLGPDKLPEAMRKAGKVYNDFKKMTSGFQDEMRSVLDEPMREFRETADLVKSSAMFDPSLIAPVNSDPPASPVVPEIVDHTPSHASIEFALETTADESAEADTVEADTVEADTVEADIHQAIVE